jgi:hypothetical protein
VLLEEATLNNLVITREDEPAITVDNLEVAQFIYLLLHNEKIREVITLAGMCLFIIADITHPKSVPLELHATIPNYMIPCVPILQGGEGPFAMFVDLWKKYREWMFEPLTYDSIAGLVEVCDIAVIEPAKRRREELSVRKAEELITRHVNDYR